MLVGHAIEGLPQLLIPVLSGLPVIGPCCFARYHGLSCLRSVGRCCLVPQKNAAGGATRRGDNQRSAHALGYPVLRVRLLAVLFGGMMAGLGGAYLPLMLTPHWAEGMTAGRGWIALALVVFASWLPGGSLWAQLSLRHHNYAARRTGAGLDSASQFLSMLPYIATIVVLVLISRNRDFALANFPSCLGRVFHVGK